MVAVLGMVLFDSVPMPKVRVPVTVAATSLTAGSVRMVPLLSTGKLKTGFVTCRLGLESEQRLPQDTNVVLQLPPEEQR